MKMTIINRATVPLDETKFKVMVELMGVGSNDERPAVDLVTILDVSGSMAGEKLEKMKTAMQFVIKKLSPIDRLSIVTFANDSTRLCPLRQITENFQAEIENLVNGLVANGGTNITAGLETGLKVLNDRRVTRGNAAIMLMSDGQQTTGDAATVPVGNVPVYTFGLGADHDPKVLKAIAVKSREGTFSDVQEEEKLSFAFSQCLGGLLSVAVEDLTLTVTRIKSKIKKVYAGNYPQSSDDVDGSVTVSFGNLYKKELRKVIVELDLPPIDSRMVADVLIATYTHTRNGKKPFKAASVFVGITRTADTTELEREEVMIEEKRLDTARMIKQAISKADNNKLDDARNIVVEAQNLLGEGVDESNPLIEKLYTELEHLVSLMTSQKHYDKQGRPFALSFETSHDRQRFAARGDIEKLRLFATPRMDTYLEQVKSFVKDPSKPLPTVDEDLKQEVAADPLAPLVGALSYYIQTAIQSLRSIEDVLKSIN